MEEKKYQNKNGEYDWINKFAEDLTNLFFSKPGKKYTLNEYYEIVCEHIEKLMRKISKKNNNKCFGGKCEFSIKKIKDKNASFSIFSGTEIEYITSDIILYFKGDDDKWETLETTGRIKPESFNLEDDDTKEFITKLKKGEKVTENIDPLSED